MSTFETSVKYYDSSMAGAPSDATYLGVLDACLVNGFGAVTLTSLSVYGNLATAVVSGGHGFTQLLNTIDPVIQITGATPTDLNGEWRITIVDSTTFTFKVFDVPNGTATGTIIAKRAPLGWSGSNGSYTNKTSVASVSISQNANNTWKLITVNSLTTIYFAVTSAIGSPRPWRIIGDHRAVWIFSSSYYNNYTDWSGIAGFGEYRSIKANSTGAVFSMGHSGTAYTANTLYNGTASSSPQNGHWCNYGGFAKATCQRYGSTYIGAANFETNPAIGDDMYLPIQMWCANSFVGWLPGIYAPLNSVTQETLYTAKGIVPYATRSVFCELWFPYPGSGQKAYPVFDLTGPWYRS